MFEYLLRGYLSITLRGYKTNMLQSGLDCNVDYMWKASMLNSELLLYHIEQITLSPDVVAVPVKGNIFKFELTRKCFH